MDLQIRALILDCDGVIADTEAAHYAMFNRVLQSRGFTMTRETYDRHYLALNDRECFTAFSSNNRLNWSQDMILRLARMKAKHYGALLGRTRLRYYPGIQTLVRRTVGTRPVAVYSGALRKEVIHILRGGGLLDHVSALVSANDVEKGKPHPEGFLTALDVLNGKYSGLGLLPTPGARRWRILRDGGPPIRRSECLVIEDSPAGIEAAKKAGMRCVAVTNSYPRRKLRDADLVVASLSGTSFASVGNRLGGIR